MSEHGGNELVGITRMDDEGRDLLAIAQAKMRPGLARVGRFVDAVAHRQVGTMQALAAGYVDDVGIGGSDGDGSNRLRGFMIEDGIPGAAVVIRLPDASIDLPSIEDVRLARNSGGGAGASSAQRADHAPVQIAVEALGNLCPALGRGKENCE